MFQSFSRCLGVALFLFAGTATLPASDEEVQLAVRFTREGVSFSGTMDTEENALALAETVKSVRPDLPILNQGLKIDPDAKVPGLSDLKSLLAELGISTQEGSFILTKDSATIGGMTDSRITMTALKIRLDPLLENRAFINRLCIVGKDDLPKFSVQLSGDPSSGPLLDFDVAPPPSEAFEPPGLSIANLFPMMLTLSDLSRLKEPVATTGAETPPSARPPVPLLQIRNIGGAPERSPAPMLRATPTIPQPTIFELSSIRFSRNSFLLQANQDAAVDMVVKQLMTPPFAGNQIILRPVKSAGQSGAFSDYLVEKRAEATKTLLIERGVAADIISIEPLNDPSTMDDGEVKLLVKVPPQPDPEPDPEPEPEPVGGEATETASAVEAE